MGSQNITVSRLSSDSSLSYLRLLFPNQGVCEITGLLICSLVDMRYNPYCDIHSDEKGEQDGEGKGEGEVVARDRLSFGEYLFQNCDVNF